MVAELDLSGVRLRRAFVVRSAAEAALARPAQPVQQVQQVPQPQPQLPIPQDSFSVTGSQSSQALMAPSMFVPPPSSARARLNNPRGYSPSTAICGIVKSLLQRFMSTILGGLGQVGRRVAPGTAILADPALTVEDKVTLMLMEIMKKMDREIQMQMIKIQVLQAQQGITKAASGAASMVPMFGGAGQIIGGVAEAASPSIDVESMKLKRLIDKRSQMFDMLRQIIDKYNQTAKGIIDSQSK